MGDLYADSDHVHSRVSYQQATYERYDRRGHESPSGSGPLDFRAVDGNKKHQLVLNQSKYSP